MPPDGCWASEGGVIALHGPHHGPHPVLSGTAQAMGAMVRRLAPPPEA